MRTIDGTEKFHDSGDARVESRWQLGAREIDALIGPQGLNPLGLHEIKPCKPITGTAAAGDLATAMGFALRLSATPTISLTDS